MPIVLVGEKFWRQAMNIDFLVEESIIDVEDRELFWYAETAEEIWDSIQNWECANAECYGRDVTRR
jgi:predicted Rossmann-fold nucleotide-binding protein